MTISHKSLQKFENDYDFPSRYLNHYLNMCQSEKKSYDLCISPKIFRFGVKDIPLHNDLNL
jgi:hypothetical protein